MNEANPPGRGGLSPPGSGIPPAPRGEAKSFPPRPATAHIAPTGFRIPEKFDKYR